MNSFTDNLRAFARDRWPVMLACSLVVIGYMYLSYTGNRFCDCQSTETYRDESTSGRSRFYHK